MTQRKLKLKLLWEIVKNLGRLLSWDFWWKTLTDEDFEAWSFAKIIFMTAAADIALVCTREDYPDLDPQDD